MSSHLETLPTPLLIRILAFLNQSDYLRCERTCKTLAEILFEDKVWESCHGAKSAERRLKTYREKACILRNLLRIRILQKEMMDRCTIQAFGNAETACKQWKKIVTRILVHCLPPNLKDGHYYFLRGDTMNTLIDILETYLIRSFQRAQLILSSCHSSDKDYPVLRVSHLKLQDMLGQSGSCPRFIKDYSKERTLFAKSLGSSLVRERIIQKASLLAGIPKIENEVHDAVWASVVELIYQMFLPACQELVQASRSIYPTQQPRLLRVLGAFDTIRNIPPYANVLPGCEFYGKAAPLLHTPVPRQLEHAAGKLLPVFPTNTYNGWDRKGGEAKNWLAEDLSRMKFEVEAARAEYSFTTGEQDDASMAEKAVVPKDRYIPLGTIRKDKQNARKLLLQPFGDQACEVWKGIVLAILNDRLPVHLTHHQHYFLRGDTMITIVETLGQFLITSFERAYLLQAFRAPCVSRHVLGKDLFVLQDVLGQKTDAIAFAKFHPSPQSLQFANALVGPLNRNQIVLGAARLAGFASVEPCVLTVAWESLVEFTHCLLQPVCEFLVGINGLGFLKANQGRKRVLYPGETMHMIAPFSSMLSSCEDCSQILLLHTPVPCQIDDAAVQLLPAFSIGPHSPYVELRDWLTSTQSTSEREMVAAAAEYTSYHHEDDEDSDYETSGYETDSNTESSCEEDADSDGAWETQSTQRNKRQRSA